MRARIKGTNTLIDVNWIDGDDFRDCRTGALLNREQLEFTDLGPIGPLTIEKPLESKIEFMINWEQERVNIAKDAMAGIIANSNNDDYRYVERGCSQNYKYKLQRADIAHRAVLYADALISELKRKDDGEEV